MRLPWRKNIERTAWIGALCLDAPVVALGWAWLICRENSRWVQPEVMASLVLGVWLVYALDRFFPAWGIGAEEETQRHIFWFQHKKVMSIPIALVMLIILYLIFFRLPQPLLWQSSGLVLMMLLYVLVCRWRQQGKVSPNLKILMCGCIFALGVVLPARVDFLQTFGVDDFFGTEFSSYNFGGFCGAVIAQGVTALPRLLVGTTAFLAIGFVLNCSAIQLWQSEKKSTPTDNSSRGESQKSEYLVSAGNQFKLTLIVAIGIVSLAILTKICLPAQYFGGLAITFKLPSLVSMAISLIALFVLHQKRAKISGETLRFLADLVFLTPFMWILSEEMLDSLM